MNTICFVHIYSNEHTQPHYPHTRMNSLKIWPSLWENQVLEAILEKVQKENKPSSAIFLSYEDDLLEYKTDTTSLNSRIFQIFFIQGQ